MLYIQQEYIWAFLFCVLDEKSSVKEVVIFSVSHECNTPHFDTDIDMVVCFFFCFFFNSFCLTCMLY